MIPVTDLRPGLIFKEQNNLFRVLEYKHQKIARGGGTIIVKVRNLRNGTILRKTFHSGAKIDSIHLTTVKAQYLYKVKSEKSKMKSNKSEERDFVFMDMGSFRQYNVGIKILDEKVDYLKEGLEVIVRLYEEEVIDIELPIKVDYVVTEAPPGVRGDTAQGGVKEVVLENGLTVKVPMFIKKGNIVKIDTRDSAYVERV